MIRRKMFKHLRTGPPLLLIALLCSCGEKENYIREGNPDPAPLSDGQRSMHVMMNAKEEDSYDVISAAAVESVYSLEAETVSCVLSDPNIGNGFYFYEIPYIEFYTADDRWQRLYYDSDRLPYAQWLLCYVDESSPSSCVLTIQMNRVDFDFTPGKYRFVIFTAENVRYAEFELR